MLRTALYIVGGLSVVGGVMLTSLGCVPAVWLIGMGLTLIAGLLFEHWRYKDVTGKRPGPEWQATGERFVDPESGKLVEVYFHPASGERRYVAV